jgi:hypothetical protein
MTKFRSGISGDSKDAYKRSILIEGAENKSLVVGVTIDPRRNLTLRFLGERLGSIGKGCGV